MTMKKGISDIQLLHHPMNTIIKSDHESDSGILNNKIESFNKINTENLGEPYYDKLHLKPINEVIFLVLNFKDPFRANHIRIGRPYYKWPCVILMEC